MVQPFLCFIRIFMYMLERIPWWDWSSIENEGIKGVLRAIDDVAESHDLPNMLLASSLVGNHETECQLRNESLLHVTATIAIRGMQPTLYKQKLLFTSLSLPL